jgi:hypothetical protein
MGKGQKGKREREGMGSPWRASEPGPSDASYGRVKMKQVLAYFVMPSAILAALLLGMHGVLTARVDRGFSWAITIGAAAVGILSIAATVHDVYARIDRLKTEIGTLRDRLLEQDRQDA